MRFNPYPKIKAPKATTVAAGFSPAPKSASLLRPEMSPGEYLNVLEQNQMSQDSIKLLAHGMPARESVWYACRSTERVAGKLTPGDRTALQAAQTWVKDPTPATQARAAAAAAATDYQGPGAWAAQAAAWSATPGVPRPPAVPGVPSASLAPHAAAGSVLLAASLEADVPKPPVPPLKPPEMPELQKPERPAIPQVPLSPPVEDLQIPDPTPAELSQTAKAHQPYVDLGKEIAAGKDTWS